MGGGQVRAPYWVVKRNTAFPWLAVISGGWPVSYVESRKAAYRFATREEALAVARGADAGWCVHRIVRIVPRRRNDEEMARTLETARAEECGALLERESVAAWLEKEADQRDGDPDRSVRNTADALRSMATRIRSGAHRERAK